MHSLMDAEFKIANKGLGRKALVHEEKSNSVEPDQYGCYKKDKLINACLHLSDLL